MFLTIFDSEAILLQYSSSWGLKFYEPLNQLWAVCECYVLQCLVDRYYKQSTPNIENFFFIKGLKNT